MDVPCQPASKKTCQLVLCSRIPDSDAAANSAQAMQAYEKHELHRTYEKYAESAGEGGLLRLSVLGVNRVLTTTPQAFADVLRKAGFLRKPVGSYHVFYMFVRTPLFPDPSFYPPLKHIHGHLASCDMHPAVKPCSSHTTADRAPASTTSQA